MRFLLLFSCLVFGKITAQTSSIYEKTPQMQAFKGYFNFFWDEKEGKIWLEIDKLDKEFLYVNSLPAAGLLSSFRSESRGFCHSVRNLAVFVIPLGIVIVRATQKIPNGMTKARHKRFLTE